MHKALRGVVASFATLILVTSTALAEDNQPPAAEQNAPAAAQPPASTPAPGSPDEVICRALDDEQVTGTRVQHKRKICQTRREWQEQENVAQNTMQHLQDEGRFKNAPTPGNSDTNGR